MKRPTKAQLRAWKIYNPHNLAMAGDSKLYVTYYPQNNVRIAGFAKWVVQGIGIKTNSTSHWSDEGCKTFPPDYPLNKANKEAARDEALLWASKHFGPFEWERDPFGAYQIKGTMAKAMKGSETL